MEHQIQSASTLDSRADYAGSRHHVMSRGGCRRNIFDGVKSRLGFLSLLRDLESRFGVRVHAYALMGNHYHLLLSSHRGKLSAALQYVNGIHARRFNRRREQDGPLYRGRFVSRVVEDDRYWVYLLAYVHLNPLKDGFVRDVAELPWTSHRRYLGGRDADFVHVDEHLALLEGVQGYRHLIEGVSGGSIPEPEGLDVAQFPKPLSVRHPSGKGVRALRDVLMGLPVCLRDLRQGRRTVGPGALSWITWWLDQELGLQRAELARLMGVSRSTVTRRIQSVDRGRAGTPPSWLDGRVDLEAARASA